MPTGDVDVAEFQKFVEKDYGSRIAGEFVRALGAAGSPTSYGHAMKTLETVLSRHTASTRSWRTTCRPDISWVT
jgi:hypothetical protein